MGRNQDNKNRWRNVTIGFRMSPEEADQLTQYAKLSGLSKQDYIIKKVLQREVVINPNPRVHKAIEGAFATLAKEIEQVNIAHEEMLELFNHVKYIIEKMKGDAID